MARWEESLLSPASTNSLGDDDSHTEQEEAEGQPSELAGSRPSHGQLILRGRRFTTRACARGR